MLCVSFDLIPAKILVIWDDRIDNKCFQTRLISIESQPKKTVVGVLVVIGVVVVVHVVVIDPRNLPLKFG